MPGTPIGTLSDAEPTRPQCRFLWTRGRVGKRPSLKRILVVRPDRIGDVLLSTPVIDALRKACPSAFMMALVAPHSEEIVDRNPFLNGFLILDKKGRHQGARGMIRLVRELKSHRFDTAIVLHGTKRVHLALALAAIPRRIGYDRKWGFLLTKRLKDVKVYGERHEAEYSLDLLRALGIPAEGGRVTMPTTHESDLRMERFLREEGVSEKDLLIAIHPGASSISKRWMSDRFAQLADRLQNEHYKVVMVSGPEDVATGEAVIRAMKRPPLDACGKTTIRELASLFKRTQLLISNDSGPVHVAVGVGTPVISIFGRSQPGLSQKRWRPLGEQDIVLQKDVGCAVCLADDCQINFECLRALSVEEVLKAAHQILSNHETSRAST